MTTKKVGRRAWEELHASWKKEANSGRVALGKGSEALRRHWESRGCGRCVREHMVRYDVLTLEAQHEALTRWRDPSTRRADRFYCTEHTAPGEAGVARMWQAFGGAGVAGHVAWAFKMDTWTWEHRRRLKGTGPYQVGSFGAAGGFPFYTKDTHYQQDTAGVPPTWFSEQGYDAYKPMGVPEGNFEEAVLTALAISEGPYELIGYNCVDAAREVLTAYGVRNLPNPALPTNATPVQWFEALPGGATPLPG